MSAFTTLGPVVHNTDEGYAVHPMIRVVPGAPAESALLGYVVLSPDFTVVHEGTRDDCILAADEYDAASEPGLP